MRIELIKENRIGDSPWYSIYINGGYKTGSSDEFKLKKLYFELISDTSVLSESKEVLHCAEIIVPSEYTKKQ